MNGQRTRIVHGLFGLMLLLGLTGAAQNGNMVPEYRNPNGGHGLSTNRGAAEDSMEDEKRLKALNTLRQRSMVSDANRLLQLANELNQEIGTTNPDTLTPIQLRKLADIEKLAHNVKEKMSTSVRDTPSIQPQFPF